MAVAAGLGGYPGGGAAAAGEKRIATFSCDVTLPFGTPIYSSFKPLEVVEHPLLAKGIILEDNGKRYVLCAVDWCELLNGTHTMFQQKVAEAAGTDISLVAVQCVHQHTAPIADGEAMKILDQQESPPPHPSATVFENAASRLAEAVRLAVPNLRPYDQVGTGQAKVDRVASNRRIPAGEGKVGFRASSCKDPKIRDLPEGLIDPWLKTITFADKGQPIVRLHYYATHPQSFYGDPRATYDFPGIARERLQEEEKVFQVYFTGCSGNVAAGKYNDASLEARTGLAQRMYEGMQTSAASTKFAPAGDIAWKTCPFALSFRHDGEYAEDAVRARMSNPQLTPNDRNGAAWDLSSWARAGEPIELSALWMGDIRIIHLPGEPMIEFQLHAQECGAGKFVATAGYGDGCPGYICTEQAFPEGGYEPTASRIVPESEAPFREAIRILVTGA